MLDIWTLYRRPRDLPQFEIVARKWTVDSNGYRPTGEAYGFNSLAEARTRMEEMGLNCLLRTDDDDPVIVETWI